MANSLVGADSLTFAFGSTDHTYGYFENLEFTESVETTEQTDADGDIVDVAFSGRKYEVTGTYVYRASGGATGTALDSPHTITITIPAGFPTLATAIYLTEVKYSARKGEFMTIDFTGTSYPSLVA